MTNYCYNKPQTQIYTFWEPKESIPYYLQLCIETWKKFLPDASVTILDNNSVREYVDIDSYGKNLFSGKFSLAQIADAVRVMVLEKYGGIWLDIDTVILKDDALKYFQPDEEAETLFFGIPEIRTVHLAAIYSKPKARNMRLWVEYIRNRVQNFDPPKKNFWGYLGNSFIDVYSKAFPNEIRIIDCVEVMPERYLAKSYSDFHPYQDFYFLQKRHLSDIDASMLLLHNSWTPPVFKRFSKEDFMRCDCTLANILREALCLESSCNESPLIFHKRRRNIWTRICRKYLWDKFAILV